MADMADPAELPEDQTTAQDQIQNVHTSNGPDDNDKAFRYFCTFFAIIFVSGSLYVYAATSPSFNPESVYHLVRSWLSRMNSVTPIFESISGILSHVTVVDMFYLQSLATCTALFWFV
jgi:hypothetical protein